MIIKLTYILLTGVPPCMGSVILTCESVLFCDGVRVVTVAGTIGRVCTMDVPTVPA